ncbi:peptide chain release factor 2 [Theileria orientalis]|uniref:Peptide chain release factor 2 n=1 Tax=Theileria orientalis TaxID=68886 RepID=A0A976SKJ4_THEOR|nr:peptide chain release factor 2 [Theileria orientalis]
MFCRNIYNASVFRRFFSVNIPFKKLQVSTSRSSGPGGQSVNKSETKVQIRFNVQSADWLSDELKEKFLYVWMCMR